LDAVANSLVCIVTPVHNGEQHLAECLDSVLAQTYAHWEYVVVDNSSTDRTPEIVSDYSARDNRIRLARYAEFVDVIGSYNRAFAEVSPASTYAKVLGADDLLYPACLERMVALADEHPAVGIVSAYRLDGDRVDLQGLPAEQQIYPGGAVLRQSLLGGPYVTGSASSLLLRSDLVRQRQPFYDMSFRHADTEAAYWMMTRSDFGLVHEMLTFTRRPPAGETPTSTRIGTYAGENLRMLIRYGPAVLAGEEYRRRLRQELAAYGWWLCKQRVKPSRRADPEFQSFHRRVIDLIRVEGATQREVRLASLALGALVRRGA
jgi:glycosyltransferase involved in cell wall biosynthesis